VSTRCTTWRAGPAIEDAGRYDTKILVEEAIEGRELECGILGNHDPRARWWGDRPGHEFYDYEDGISTTP
jgi:D-alanine-D-alanine ligase